jgi:hypothetical protein
MSADTPTPRDLLDIVDEISHLLLAYHLSAGGEEEATLDMGVVRGLLSELQHAIQAQKTMLPFELKTIAHYMVHLLEITGIEDCSRAIGEVFLCILDAACDFPTVVVEVVRLLSIYQDRLKMQVVLVARNPLDDILPKYQKIAALHMQVAPHIPLGHFWN